MLAILVNFFTPSLNKEADVFYGRPLIKVERKILTHSKVSTELFKYCKDPIKQAACLIIFQVFFSVGLCLIEPARLTILTKSSTLIANLLSKFEYFLSKWTDFTLLYD